jgi:hypothetical protein
MLLFSSVSRALSAILRQVKLKSEIPPIMLRNFPPIAKFRIFLKFTQLSENCDFAPLQNLGKFKF